MNNQTQKSKFLYAGITAFAGKLYYLTDQADLTSRPLPTGYTNYLDAQEDQAFDFEMSAPALDSEGQKYLVYWLFSARKQEAVELQLEAYNYEFADQVEQKD